VSSKQHFDAQLAAQLSSMADEADVDFVMAVRLGVREYERHAAARRQARDALVRDALAGLALILACLALSFLPAIAIRGSQAGLSNWAPIILILSIWIVGHRWKIA
jgi:hypothetical protein